MTRVLGIAAASVISCSVCISAFTSTVPSKLATYSRQLTAPLQTKIDVEEEAPRDIYSFEEWASYGGIQKADGFQLVSEELDGFLDVSAMTTQDIPAGSPVVYVPNEMILSSNKAMEQFGRIQEAEQILRDNGYESNIRQYYLMLKILAELEKGQDSPWFPYLNSLPRYFSNGASMTLFCYTCIPPLLAALCKEERARLNNLSVKRPVTFLSNGIKENAKLWKWAYQVVYTRGFEANDGSGDFCIAPMADMFNHHGLEPEIALAYDESGNCYAQTVCDVLANSPLRMSYGDATNPSFLLARYGFLDESAPATFCKIMPSHVSEEMKNLGYAQDRMLFYKDTGDTSEEVWDILLYMALGETDEATQQQFYQAHMAGDYATKQSIHDQYYPLTMSKLSDHIETFLDELEALEKKGEYGGKVAADDHPRLPLILRHNEFVKNTFLTVRNKQGLDQNSDNEVPQTAPAGGY
eukprot:CAMPEP_0172563396 /NCGR_PEP_ID=MMETSP1067-20121228/100548_1 /TAXON_ID=265564 ORGANISM="Thalassiosira punctigera, Strain Tpunct2005C2" /NCGR_SAMPLE_ID=MMETSP1067 /ASSEMBLY_ACC=CAM_ASM_000444 /LENGTH=466 /DNA_ID=CAMNT_0013353835 /DNA_START=14 /DNA_END=1414 /DNA_ORIENTATION=-